MVQTFELLDAIFASALNKIIQNTRFKKKVSQEEMKAHKEDRFFRGRQIAYLIYEYFRVTGANDSVENYADLFAIVFRNDIIQEFDTKWDEIQLSMTQIPSDEILESLYKLRIRESEKLKTVENQKSQEAEVQVGKWLDCRARITSKELAPLHSVKNGILRSACSTSLNMDTNLGISALTHTARLTNCLAKGLKRMVTKLQWLF